jgi:hypothetical protein
MKDGRSFALLITCITLLAAGDSLARDRRPLTPITEIQIGVGLNRTKVSGGETVGGRVEVRRNGNTQELVFRLETNNPSARLSTTEIRLKPDQSSASFEILTSATPIKITIDVKALLQPADQVQSQKTLEVVPAILKGVSLVQPTLHGTRGANITVRAELNSAAPIGGIELYLQLFCATVEGKFIRLDVANPRVAAGSKEVSFDVPYNKLYLGDRKISATATGFDEQTRILDLVVSLEVQSTKLWEVISGIAKKVSFDVIPLRVASISVQPTTVTGGAEALATFTLNIPPGSNETLRLSPTSTSTSRKAWTRLLGTSCQSVVQDFVELQLAPGVTTYSFKVCTASVTTATPGTLSVFARSGSFPASIVVQP